MENIISEITPGDIVEVRFWDLIDNNEWMPFGKTQKEAMKCKIVGYFMDKNDSVTRIASVLSSDNDVGYHLVIPIGCIISVEKIRDDELNDWE